MQTKLICWNVNGVRAVLRHGFLDWLRRESPDILCLQEVKATPDILPPELVDPSAGYTAYWNYPAKKGYAGVATFCKEKPLTVRTGYGLPEYDDEGRVLITEHGGFTLLNVYFPNGKQGPERLEYKLGYYDAFLDYVDSLKSQGAGLVICGDFNTAHKEIDLARPGPNSRISGFLPVERAWMDKLVEHGYIDTFRYFNQEPGQYTWWDIKTGARERNVGWRIDYFFVSDTLIGSVLKSEILRDVTGSDHCPIRLTLEV